MSEERLHIFNVSCGDMLTFQFAEFGARRVRDLKLAVSELHNVPVDRQVLLISGGENLVDEDVVAKYQAGTESNPIFLFNKRGEASIPENTAQSDGVMAELERARNGSSAVTIPSLERQSAAARSVVLASEQLLTSSKRLVHDQHLLHQAWCAVTASLQDYARELQLTVAQVKQRQSNMADRQLSAQTALSQLADTSAQLSAIRLPVQLDPGRRTLLAWITDREPLAAVEERFRQLVSSVDEAAIERLVGDVKKCVDESQRRQLSEISGLTERFTKLNEWLNRARERVDQQRDCARLCATTFEQLDTSRADEAARTLRDQLARMAEALQQLASIQTRCFKAKVELIQNVHERLSWVVRLQTQMVRTNSGLLSQYEALRRLEVVAGVLQQLVAAPSVYCRCLTEVTRRRNFTQLYTAAASRAAAQFLHSRQTETKKRNLFKTEVGSHFIRQLFSLDDIPPSFAQEPISDFDTELPAISESHTFEVQRVLGETVPSAAMSMSVQLPLRQQELHLQQSTTLEALAQLPPFGTSPSTNFALASHEAASSWRLSPPEWGPLSPRSRHSSASDTAGVFFSLDNDDFELEQTTSTAVTAPECETSFTGTLEEDALAPLPPLSTLDFTSVLQSVSTLRSELDTIRTAITDVVKSAHGDSAKLLAEVQQQALREAAVVASLQAIRVEELERALQVAREAQQAAVKTREEAEVALAQAACERNTLLRQHADELSSTAAAHQLNTDAMEADLKRRLDSADQEVERLHAAEESRLSVSSDWLHVPDLHTEQLAARLATLRESDEAPPLDGLDTALAALLERLRPPEQAYGTLLSDWLRLYRSRDDAEKAARTATPVAHPLDKISITTCNRGELVLLCADERGQYMVFNLTAINHYLHPDCLGPLGLSGVDPPRAWQLAVVTEKSYYQVKKEQNRYNLPRGTKFGRVWAKSWTPGASALPVPTSGLPSSSMSLPSHLAGATGRPSRLAGSLSDMEQSVAPLDTSVWPADSSAVNTDTD